MSIHFFKKITIQVITDGFARAEKVCMPVPDREVPYGEITIGYGETLKLTSFRFTFTFSEVRDSRCPTGLQCVWEGEVVIVLHCWAGSQYLGVMEIKAPPAEPRYAGVQDQLTYYRLTCLAVDPYPVEDVQTPLEDYVATLGCMIAVP